MYIGNKTPEQLNTYPMPWYDIKDEKGGRHGKFGQIVPQDEFLALMRLCDAFDLVKLSEEFVAAVRPKNRGKLQRASSFIRKIRRRRP